MRIFKNLNTPNKLTISRLFGVLIIIVLAIIDYYSNFKLIAFSSSFIYTYPRIIILFIFLLCSYTDHLDGKLARKNNQITILGQFLDPIADKALNNSLFVILACFNEISFIVPLVFILRDLIVDGIRILAATKSKIIPASLLGKIKTVIQVILITYFLSLYPLFDTLVVLKYIGYILEIITVIISLVSCIEYLIKNKDLFLEGNK